MNLAPTNITNSNLTTTVGNDIRPKKYRNSIAPNEILQSVSVHASEQYISILSRNILPTYILSDSSGRIIIAKTDNIVSLKGLTNHHYILKIYLKQQLRSIVNLSICHY